MSLPEGINWAAIATFVLAGVTVFLAVAAFRSIAENRRIRSEDKKLASLRRRFNEVHSWINNVLILIAEASGAPGEPAERRRRASFARTIVADAAYAKMEAQRLDTEFGIQPRLADHVGRLTFILEQTHPDSLGANKIQHEVLEKCVEALKVVSNLKAQLGL